MNFGYFLCDECECVVLGGLFEVLIVIVLFFVVFFDLLFGQCVGFFGVWFVCGWLEDLFWVVELFGEVVYFCIDEFICQWIDLVVVYCDDLVCFYFDVEVVGVGVVEWVDIGMCGYDCILYFVIEL